MFAVEAVMKALAEKVNEDPKLWALAGLLHDLDYDKTVNEPQRHGIVTTEMLVNEDVPKEVIHAIKAHNAHVPLESKMDIALYASDPVTGLIIAATLMHPEKKLSGVDTQFVMKRFKEKRFAAGANRDQMRKIGELGIELEEFISISLRAMQSIDSVLGL
jgi:putative nucleotidyltransferase with HDIG domain